MMGDPLGFDLYPNSWTSWFATVLWLMLSPIGLIYAATQANDAWEVSHWPTTRGELVRTEMIEREVRQKRSTSTVFEAKVEYKYEVDGVSYRGHKVARGYHASGHEHHHEAILQKLRSGTQVTVRFNAADPNEAYLAAGAVLGVQLEILMGVFWFAMTSVSYFLYRFSDARSSALIENLLDSGRRP